MAGLIDWLFRNRQTGRLTVAQRPNAALAVYLVAVALRLLASPHGRLRTAVDLVADVALIGWAGGELVIGVNPFRRLLGASVLAAVLAALLR